MYRLFFKKYNLIHYVFTICTRILLPEVIHYDLQSFYIFSAFTSILTKYPAYSMVFPFSFHPHMVRLNAHLIRLFKICPPPTSKKSAARGEPPCPGIQPVPRDSQVIGQTLFYFRRFICLGQFLSFLCLKIHKIIFRYFCQFGISIRSPVFDQILKTHRRTSGFQDIPLDIHICNCHTFIKPVVARRSYPPTGPMIRL